MKIRKSFWKVLENNSTKESIITVYSTKYEQSNITQTFLTQTLFVMNRQAKSPSSLMLL